jgi:paraquat-inducible protein B
MPNELKDRPSDATGSIRKQPEMEQMVPIQGSRDLAHNTDFNNKKELVDLPLPKMEPLVMDSKEVTTGQEALILRKAKRELRKKIVEDLQEFKSIPNNPKRKRLEHDLQQVDRTVKKATRFLDQWQHLDNNKYLQHLIDTNDELASSAKQLLYFRTGFHRITFSEQEKEQMVVISRTLRDKLYARIRVKERAGNG